MRLSSIVDDMEITDIPKTPPPPYRTLPPTPAPSIAPVEAEASGPASFPPHNSTSANYQSVDYHPAIPAHQQGVPNALCAPAYGIPPHNYYACQRYHGALTSLPYRPMRRCSHPSIHRFPTGPTYYAHVGGNAAHFTQSPQPRAWQSYLQLGSISATLNDAGNLAVEAYDSLVNARSTREQYGGVVDAVAVRLDNVLTSMDDGTFRMNSADLAISENQAISAHPDAATSAVTLVETSSSSPKPSLPERHDKHSKRRTHRRHASSSSINVNSTVARIPATSTQPFSKVYQYANAYTSNALPPLKLYFATWPLICLASTYSRQAYDKPSSKERQSFIAGDWRRGTKAVVLKSIPLDEKNTIVLAIRGTQNFQDWAVNIRTEPTAPINFFDDEGNLCHAGFLSVARKMVAPVAAQLQDLLRENPRRSSCSLVLTGHSAGGAVAAMLYCHMLSQTVSSELTHLQDLFKRVHCVTFGAPPISLLPLQKPASKTRFDKNIFFGFVNEGDPVTRADKTYVKNLLELYSRPAPAPSRSHNSTSASNRAPFLSLSVDSLGRTNTNSKPIWKVPEATLSLAGRIVVLRARQHSPSEQRATKNEGTRATGRKDKEKDNKKSSSSSSSSSSSDIVLEAVTASDAELRGLVFGDPLMHTMDLYAQRIEKLATKAVVGSTFS